MTTATRSPDLSSDLSADLSSWRTSVTGVGRLTRLALRRDRIRIWLWMAGIGGVVMASALSLPPVYPDQASLESYAATVGDNPALMAFAGPGHGLEQDPTIGAVLVNEVQLWAAIGFALMSIFLVNHHTRAEEDVERADLLRSAVVGRHATTTAAMAVVGAANVVLAALCAVGFVLTDYDATGSVLLAASMGAVGLVFVGVTGVAAQVAGSGRSTLGIATSVLAAAFVLRAIGDISGNGLHWASPIGWAQATRPFAGGRWWPLVLCLAFAVAMVALAFWTSTRRDLGSGLLTSRPGPERAGRTLTSPLGLALRLHRGALIGWSIGIFLAGTLYGSIGDDVEQMIEDNPAYEDVLAQIGGADLTDSFFASSMLMLALIVSGFAISTVLRLRTEENAGRADAVLASGVGRTRWAASHLAVAVVGTAWVMALGGLGVGLAYAAVADEGGQVGRMVGAALTTLPAIVVMVGVVTLLHGLAPRLAMVAWGALAVVTVLTLFAEVLRIPSWARNVSPFHHSPQVPAESFAWLPVLALLAVGAALGAAGLAALGRRDIADR